MKVWIVDNGFQIDFNEAPHWATKVAWRRLGDPTDGLLLRVWVDENNTQYQYLRGFGTLCKEGVVYYGNFFAEDWKNPAKIIARREGFSDEIPDPEPMVCHDKYGFMTDEFRRYSQRDWDRMRDEVQGIIRTAINCGVSPVAMKELLTAAVDCGTTLAMSEMKAEDARK